MAKQSTAQAKARANFKKKVAEAKKIQAAHPNMKWCHCVKKAYKK